MFRNWSEGGGQRFSKCSENQKDPNYPIGVGWGKFKLGKVPKFSRFHILMASLIVLIDSAIKIWGYRRSCWVTFEKIEIFRFLGGPYGGFPLKKSIFFHHKLPIPVIGKVK